MESETFTEAEFQAALALTMKLAPPIASLPKGWTKYPDLPKADPLHGIQVYQRGSQFKVVFTAGLHDGKLWLHVSMSYKDRLPTYADMCEVKRLFIGEDKQAIQIFPKFSRHVNIHEYCLHLWSCLEPEGDGLPDFGRHGTI